MGADRRGVRVRPGGIFGLLDEVDAHGEAIEVDLLRLGFDLYTDLGTARLSFRRLRLLLERAPLDSEYAREKLGDQARWGASEHLLATIADLIQVGNWQFATANSRKGHAPPKPTPIERPGRTSARRSHRTQLSEREIARRLVEMQRRQHRKG